MDTPMVTVTGGVSIGVTIGVSIPATGCTNTRNALMRAATAADGPGVADRGANVRQQNRPKIGNWKFPKSRNQKTGKIFVE